MASPDSLTILLGAAVVAVPVIRNYRRERMARRVELDAAETARLMGWVQDLRDAGHAQARDPQIAELRARFTAITGRGGRHRASRLRPATAQGLTLHA